MTILSHVSVDFTDKHHNILFSVPPRLIDCVLTAPDEIQQDPIFDLLLADGSLEAVRSVARKKALENDPAAEVNAEGRKAKTDRKAAGKDTAEEEASADGKAAAAATAKSVSAGKAGAAAKAEAVVKAGTAGKAENTLKADAAP